METWRNKTQWHGNRKDPNLIINSNCGCVVNSRWTGEEREVVEREGDGGRERGGGGRDGRRWWRGREREMVEREREREVVEREREREMEGGGEGDDHDEVVTR